MQVVLLDFHNINPASITPKKLAYAISGMFPAKLFDMPPPISSVPVCAGAGFSALQVMRAE